jgi:hypothetical protein
LVIQGNGGSFSHDGRQTFAWDFAMPEGTPVLAAADGIVVETIDLYTEGAPDKALEDRNNKIILDHGGGHFSMYAHLQKAGVLVELGQRVVRGQVIGRSGNTGFSAGPHLHFAVVDHRNRSLPVCFADVEVGVPIQGMIYRRGPETSDPAEKSEPAIVPAPSLLPRDAFIENGIRLTVDLPAHVFWGGERVAGVATRPATKAFAVLYARDRRRQRIIAARVAADGRFSLVIPARALAELGPQIDFIVALASPAGEWRSDFSVPVYFGGPSRANEAYSRRAISSTK